MKRNYIFSGLLFLLLSQYTDAQYRGQSIFSSSNSKSFVYNAQNTPYGTPLAQIFQTLTQNNRQRASGNSIIIQFQENLNIYKSSQSLRFTGNISKLHISGTANYKGFNIQSFIRPQQVSFTAEWRDARGYRIISSFNFNIKLEARQTSLFDFSRQNPNPRANYKLVISRYQFLFDRRAISNLQNKIQMIDNYYRALQDIDRISRDLNLLRASNIDNILINQQKLERAKSQFSQIKSANFTYNLNLNTYDPANLMNKSAALDNLIRQKETEIRQTQAQLPQIYLNNGIQAANMGNYRQAEDYFQKAIQANPVFMPAKLELAQIYYQQRQSLKALQLAHEVSQSYNSDQYTKSGANTLLQKIYNNVLSSAQTNLDRANYTTALQNIKDAYAICQKISSISCSYKLNSMKQQALNGVYQKKLNNCKKYINNSQLINASSALAEAITFRKNNNLSISSQETSYQVLLKQKEYDISVNQAQDYARNNQFELALKKYSEAIHLQEQYSLTTDNYLQQEINKAAGNMAQTYIDQGNTELHNNRLRAAKRLAKKAGDILKQYNVPKNNPTYKQLISLRNASYSVQCQNYEMVYENKIKQVKQQMKEAKYLTADATINQSIAYAQSKKECEIDYADAQTYKDEIKPAKHYQAEIKDIIGLIDYNMFEEAIKKYNKLIDYYNDNRIDAFNITMLPLTKFAKNNSSEFILTTIRYLLDKGQNQDAYNLLIELKNRNIRKHYTRNEQSRLALAFAKNDFEKNRASKPENAILEYTFGESWFSYFKKAYLKEWKNLR